MRRTTDRSRIEPVLDEYARDPEATAEAAAEELRSAGVQDDQEILAKARQLLQEASAAEPARVESLVGQLQAKNVAVMKVNQGNIQFS